MTCQYDIRSRPVTGRGRRTIPFSVRLLLTFAVLVLTGAAPGGIWAAPEKIEDEILDFIRSRAFTSGNSDRTCKSAAGYRVVVIDNFEYRFSIVPGVETTHGEMLVKLLKSGRADIETDERNTTLGRGLAFLIRELAAGACADAVISSVPGSNYTEDQILSLLPGKTSFTPETRKSDRRLLKDLLRKIAFNGYPSVDWMEGADINLAKLREDARKFVFIEALARYNIRVILPYGNPDTLYKGRPRTVNLLSLADNAMVFTGLDQNGRRVPGFPYGPLSSGDEPAVYTILECPHPEDPSKVVLDINQDGFFDYSRQADDSPAVTYCRERGTLRGTSLIPPIKVKELLPPK